MRRPNREINIFSMSALDLFASAMGSFMIISVILMPYYLQNREVVAELARERQAGKGCLASLESTTARAEAALAEAERARKEVEAMKPRALDLVIVLDTTSSMRAAIDALKRHLAGLVRVLRELTPALRVGFVAYRDHGDAYVTREFALAPLGGEDLGALGGFIAGLSAEGGGDDQEAVEEGLAKALAQPWNHDGDGIIILVGDAPAHDKDKARVLSLAASFPASSPRRRVSAIAVGGAVEGLFREVASRGGGVYTRDTGELYESILLSVLKR